MGDKYSRMGPDQARVVRDNAEGCPVYYSMWKLALIQYSLVFQYLLGIGVGPSGRATKPTGFA